MNQSLKVLSVSFALCHAAPVVAQSSVIETNQFTMTGDHVEQAHVMAPAQLGPGPCPGTAFAGVCCLPDGVCAEGLAAAGADPSGWNESLCLALGGTFTCDTTCAAAGCILEIREPCCFPNGGCLIATIEDCGAAGGVSSGASDCVDAGCPQPAIGACCDDLACVSDVAEFECVLTGGTYLGDGTTCAEDPCAVGACCDECDGTCSAVREEVCVANGGFYLGDDSICDVDTCLLQGACCLEGNQCADRTMEVCLASGGTFEGLSTSCATTNCVGACCFPGTGVCHLRIETSCVYSGGVWQGAGTSCGGGCTFVLIQGDDAGAFVLDILRDWGQCPIPCPADVNQDGRVDAIDLVAVLLAEK